MLFKKNVIMPFRIMRALSSGEFINVSTICTMENLSSAMTYKITRKLERAGLEKSRGANGDMP